MAGQDTSEASEKRQEEEKQVIAAKAFPEDRSTSSEGTGAGLQSGKGGEEGVPPAATALPPTCKLTVPPDRKGTGGVSITGVASGSENDGDDEQGVSRRRLRYRGGRMGGGSVLGDAGGEGERSDEEQERKSTGEGVNKQDKAKKSLAVKIGDLLAKLPLSKLKIVIGTCYVFTEISCVLHVSLFCFSAAKGCNVFVFAEAVFFHDLISEVFFFGFL